MKMKRFILLTAIALVSALTAHAQTYLEHLQQSKAGQGKVTVTQSKAIDALVNGTTNADKPAAKPATPVTKPTVPTTAKTPQEARTPGRNEAARNVENTVPTEKANAAEKPHTAEKAENRKPDSDDDEMSIPTIDMRKKVMRDARKVTGYRVQAFAGGNTRMDKQKAQQIGEAIKMKFPDQPVYVHFYSPRWICRVGNYRSYQEAEHMLRQVKAMGYSSATIVKGMITIQY